MEFNETRKGGVLPGEPQTERISVKSAAAMMNMSIWQIYKMDREKGPLRFIHDRGQVFIDRVSIGNYLAGQQVGRYPTGREEILRAPATAEPTSTPTGNIGEPLTTTAGSDQGHGDRPSGSFGQRDLDFGRARSAFPIAYAGWAIVS